MKQDLEPQVRPHDAGPHTTTRTRALWAVSIVALVGVAVLLAIGLARVLSVGDEVLDRTEATPPAPTEVAAPSASSAVPAAPNLEDVVFLDVLKGGTRPLPRSLRAVAGARNFQASPDGTQVAFESASPWQISVANIDGTELRQVTHGPGSASDPRWSPDGSELVFQWSNPTLTRTNLFVVDVRTQARRQITFSSGREFREAGAAVASFSPDGGRILFTATGGNGRWLGLWTVPTAGGVPRLLIENAAYGAFSPDGTTIAYHRTRPRDSASDWWSWTPAIRLADADGSRRRRLVAADGGSYFSALTWEHTRLVWSPDGSHLACGCGAGAFHGYPNGNVRVYDAVSGDRSIVGTGQEPSWLDDRTLIVADFMAASPVAGATDLADISFVDLRTGKATPLPENIRSIAGVGHFRVSPDGAKLAFDDGEAIFVANVDGTHIRRFALQEGVSAPDWSPDGTTIVFSEGPTGFLLDVANGDITRVIRERREIWAPNFSPDGRTILYTAIRGNRLTLRTVPSTGGQSSLLLTGAFGSLSPDGTTIAYRRTDFDGDDLTEMTSGAVWLADADGRHAREIGHSCCWQSQIDPEALWPTWSPDGTKVAFQPLHGSLGMDSDVGFVKVFDVELGRQRMVGEGNDPSWLDEHTLIVEGFRSADAHELTYPVSTEPVGFTATDVLIVDPKSGEATPAFELSGHQGNGERSPDGRRLVYQGDHGDGPSQIFVLEADGTERQVTEVPGGASDPTWSPDGRQIAFAAHHNIFVVNADGSHLSKIAGTRSNDLGPDWSPDGARIAFFTSGVEGLAGIWTVEVTSGSLERLTSNAESDGDSFPAWSPDGAWIAFIRYEDTPGGNLEEVDTDFWLMRTGGAGQHRLLADEGPQVRVDLEVDPMGEWPGYTGDGHFQGSPTWSPNGRLIAYSGGHCQCLSIIDVGTGAFVRTPFTRQSFGDPSWSTAGIFVSEPQYVK